MSKSGATARELAQLRGDVDEVIASTRRRLACTKKGGMMHSLLSESLASAEGMAAVIDSWLQRPIVGGPEDIEEGKP